MSIKLPKINSNELFAPTLLVVILSITFYVNKLIFKDPYNLYSLILAISSMLALLKAFILSFVDIELNMNTKKWYFIGSDVVLSAVQFIAAWSATNFLTQNSYPHITIIWLLVANVAFSIQLFFGRAFELIQLSLITVLAYLGMAIMLTINPFASNDTRLFIASLQLVGYTALILEIVAFFRIVRKFVRR